MNTLNIGRPVVLKDEYPDDIWETATKVAFREIVLGAYFEQNYIAPIAEVLLAERKATARKSFEEGVSAGKGGE